MGSCVGSEKKSPKENPQKDTGSYLENGNNYNNYEQFSHQTFSGSLKSVSRNGYHRTRQNSTRSKNEDTETFIEQRQRGNSSRFEFKDSFVKTKQEALMTRNERPKSIPGVVETDNIVEPQVPRIEIKPKTAESLKRKPSSVINLKPSIDRFEIKTNKDNSVAIEFDKNGFDGDEIEEEDLAILAQYLIENEEFNASEIQIITSRTGNRSGHTAKRSIRGDTNEEKTYKLVKPSEEEVKRNWNRYVEQHIQTDIRNELQHDLNLNFERDLEQDLITACDIGDFNSVEFLVKHAVDCNALDQNGMSALSYASQKGHTDIVKLLIKCNADINHRDRNGMTPIMHAAEMGHFEIVEFLVSQEANVNKANIRGMNALILASKNGYKKTVKVLLKTDINVHFKDENGMTALLHAAFNGHNKVLRTLLQHDANLKDVDNNGKNVLMLAAEKGYADVVENLMDYEIDLNVKDNENMTALMHAAKNAKRREKKKKNEDGKQYAKVVEILTKYHADVNAKNNVGWTALMLASRQGSIQIVETLLIHNSNRHAKNNDGLSASKIADGKGHTDVVTLLLNFDHSKVANNKNNENTATTKRIRKDQSLNLFPNPAEIDTAIKPKESERAADSREFFITAVDVSGNRVNGKSEISNNYYVIPPVTPVSRQTSHNVQDVQKQKQKPPEIEDFSEFVPLPKQAIEHKNEENFNRNSSAPSLKRINSGPNNKYPVPSTPIDKKVGLIAASQKGQYDVVEALVSIGGTNVNEKDDQNMTALMHASKNAKKSDGTIQSNYAKIVDFLAKHKADLNCQDNEGKTAIMLAVEQEAMDVVDVLVKNKCDFFAQNNDDETVFEIASKQQDQQIFHFLLDNANIKLSY